MDKEEKLFDLYQYQPQGDQPKAIHDLVEGIREGKNNRYYWGLQVLGKTFTNIQCNRTGE